ncbi:hypothetical protein NE237_001944 [Protea cynaroides]|uniref:pectinesterase n=1 Tax=Protea cynaroides TaxID=273540 RepID=A0A9Q0KU22_9MAGN|nr:hypothetical protein NE237_001944 [Protea cynaroides]
MNVVAITSTNVTYKRCVVNVTAQGLKPSNDVAGYITAQRRYSPDDPSGFVFKTAAVVGNGLSYLGRAYGPYSRVIFVRSFLSQVVVPLGWDAWNYIGHDANKKEDLQNAKVQNLDSHRIESECSNDAVVGHEKVVEAQAFQDGSVMDGKTALKARVVVGVPSTVNDLSCVSVEDSSEMGWSFESNSFSVPTRVRKKVGSGSTRPETSYSLPLENYFDSLASMLDVVNEVSVKNASSFILSPSPSLTPNPLVLYQLVISASSDNQPGLIYEAPFPSPKIAHYVFLGSPSYPFPNPISFFVIHPFDPSIDVACLANEECDEDDHFDGYRSS